MKIFVSYTSSDRDWALWIGWHLGEAGHEPFVHEWEIGAGENIPRWMEDRLTQAERLLGVFSDAYCKALYSQSERWAAYWQDPGGRIGFLVPIEVKKVTKWPVFVEPLKRLSLIGLKDVDARNRLLEFLNPPKPPTEEPAFPGAANDETEASSPFAAGGDPIGSAPPPFPASPSVVAGLPLAIDPNTSIRCIDDHEPKPVVFGRDDEIEAIVGALIQERVALVAGGPGMGKTAVATAAIYDPRVIAHFGRRRVFASLETATEARAILAKLVEALGLSPAGDETSLMRVLETNAAERPIAAILDNAETVFDNDRVGSERLLNLVTNIEGLSLTVTIRGVAPPIPGAISIDDLPKLSANPARDAFLAVAGATFKDDPDLQHLLEALDGHALSIRLVAAQAIGLPSLKGLRESWDDAHAEILRISGEEESRLTSVRASLALSLNSRRMKSTPLARRLLALLAFLPGGLAESDVRSLIGERGRLTTAKAHEAIACLHQLRLVERRPDLRLRVLTPLRECVKTDVLPLQIDQGRLVERYLDLADKANKIAGLDWKNVREQIEVESDNLDAVCDLAVQMGVPYRVVNPALQGLTRFNIFSGKGAVGSISRAATHFCSTDPLSVSAAQGSLWLGEIAYSRSDYGTARRCFEQALTLCRRIGNVRGETYCLKNLANIAQALSDREHARILYEEALARCGDTANAQTAADCIFGLGLIALGRSDHGLGRAHLKDALTRYQHLGDALGQANVIRGISEIAARSADYVTARTRCDESLLLNRRIGTVLGEANAIGMLGNIARRLLEYDTASLCFEEARMLARRIGAVGTEGDCIKNLGLVAYARRDYERARTCFEEALTLFRKVGSILDEAEVMIRLGRVRQKRKETIQGLADIKAGFALYFGISDKEDRAQGGWQAVQVALTSADSAEITEQFEIARAAWSRLERLDLVQDWVDLG